jgi:DNA polymerase III delta prime subunit
VWYLFSRLNSALEQQDEEYYRTMFPEFSIGKLFSAKIKNLQIENVDGKNSYYTFDITELSSNMKLKEGENVLLIPNDKRGLNLDKRIYKWVINIERITWDPSINGNRIVTNPTNTNVFEVCEAEDIDPKQQEWYIYPLSTDTWSNKLHNNNDDGLFERENFGTSWLGFRLAFLWKVRTGPKLKWSKSWEFATPSIYLFAPELLSKFTTPFLSEKLLTTIHPKPDPSQEQAIKNSLTCVISAILGPPGTGKSQTIAALIDEYVMQNKKRNKSTKILVTSFSYAALKVVLEKIRIGKDAKGDPTVSALMQMVFVRSETQEPIPPIKGGRAVEDLERRGTTWKLNGKSRSVIKSKLLEESLEDSFVIFANAHHLYYLKDKVREDFAFDLICVDEASQLPTDYFMASLQFIYKSKFKIKKPDNVDVSSGNEVVDKKLVEFLEIEPNEEPPGDLTKVVIVGDHNQLPPVRIKNPPKSLGLILDSLFRYYVDGHKISSKQLKINYRSHEDIVNFTSLLGLYIDLKAFELNKKSLLKGTYDTIKEPWIKEVLDPKKVVCAIIHNQKFEIGISLFEAEIVSKIVANYYDMIEPKTEQEEDKFWKENVGVVAPHNAQGRTIIRRIFDEFSSRTLLPKPKLMELLKNTVYSVEKFQGSDRDLIITSIGLSDEDKINAEEEFIFNLNRFNVLTSRAKNKIIFISSNKFLRYIPENRKILENASKIYTFVEEFCNKEIALEIKNESDIKEKVRFRYKE